MKITRMLPGVVTRPSEYIYISLFGASQATLWQSLHTIIIPVLLLDMVPPAEKNSYLGILTFCGLIIAMLVQPVAGALSDRSRFKLGKRMPFVFIGGMLTILVLPSVGLAPSYSILFISYCMLQFVSNIGQGANIGLIPDLVSLQKRGIAAGVKTCIEVFSGAIFLGILVAPLMNGYASNHEGTCLWITLGLLAFLVLLAVMAMLSTIRESAPKPTGRGFRISDIFRVYTFNIKADKEFLVFIISRLFILMAFGTLQGFALYYIQDVIQIPNAVSMAGNLTMVTGILLLISAYPAGHLSDKMGRKPVIILSSIFGIAGIIVLLLTRDASGVLISGALLGIAGGSFMSTSWALGTDLVPVDEAARYLGLTNIASAGSGALARLIGPVIDYLNVQSAGFGYTIMLIACILYFIVGTVLVMFIKEKRNVVARAES
ncbi:MAG: MFS transporter [Dehalococcoidia bacterium]|nr:MFS transporter [Dehalococcoidia bacterium]MDD5493871.1 MFS transporter [Dehalococcoidia bacterium]